jgi:hypothetical protein
MPEAVCFIERAEAKGLSSLLPDLSPEELWKAGFDLFTRCRNYSRQSKCIVAGGTFYRRSSYDDLRVPSLRGIGVTVSVVTFISFTISGDPVGTTLGGVMLSDGTRYPM